MAEKKKEKIKREISAGGVVYKGNLFLIRETKPSLLFPKTHWMLAKGRIEENEKAEETAKREIQEELGVKVKLISKLDTVKYFYKHPKNGFVFKIVVFFLFKYIKDLPQGFDDETNQTEWLKYEDAYKKLSFLNEKRILKKAKQMI